MEGFESFLLGVGIAAGTALSLPTIGAKVCPPNQVPVGTIAPITYSNPICTVLEPQGQIIWMAAGPLLAWAFTGNLMGLLGGAVGQAGFLLFALSGFKGD